MLKALPILLVSLILTSCASGTPQRTVEIQRQPVPVSEATLAPCRLPDATLKPGDQKSVILLIWSDYAKQARYCADRHRVLAGAVRDHNDLAGSDTDSGTK